MSNACSRQRSGFSRRQLITATGAVGGGLALGAAGFTSAPLLAGALQIEATPPAAPVIAPAPPSGETVADVAARLNYDAEAIFAFVRDEIHYESYAGVLRGARGTLWARAGNAADQAVLLGELLAASQIPYRFAVGPLDAAGAEALTANLTLTTGEANRHVDDATVAAYLHAMDLTELPESLPEPDATQQAVFDRFDESSRLAVDLALASSEISRSAIADALAAAGIDLPALTPPSLPDRELNRHAWIQVADGPSWLDYDPSLAVAGEVAAPPTAAETLEVLPDDWHHWIRIAIAADEYAAGTIYRREAVSLVTASHSVVDVPIALSMASANEIAGLGLAINELFTGQTTIYPTIYADGVTVDASQPLIFATDATSTQDVLGSGTPVAGAGDGETVAVWLVVEITSPDESPVVVERALVDRVPVEDRASGTIVAENVAPIRTVPTGLGDDTLEQFNVLTIIHTDVARMSPTTAFAKFGADDVFGALGMLGPTLAGFRDTLGIQEEAAIGSWSYPSAPNITVFHVATATSESDDAKARLTADLVHRRRTSLPLSDVAPSATVHPLVLSGVLDAVAEQMLLAPETRGESPETSSYATGPSIGGIFEAAVQSGLEVRVLTSAADLGEVEADAASQGYITAALNAGLYVVVPEQPVEGNGEPVLGWWIVDPATGRTRDQIQNGMSNASTALSGRRLAAIQAIGEHSFVTRAIAWFVANSRAFLCVGLGVAFAFGFANSAIRLGNGSDDVGAVISGGLGGAAAGGAAIACL